VSSSHEIHVPHYSEKRQTVRRCTSWPENEVDEYSQKEIRIQFFVCSTHGRHGGNSQRDRFGETGIEWWSESSFSLRPGLSTLKLCVCIVPTCRLRSPLQRVSSSTPFVGLTHSIPVVVNVVRAVEYIPRSAVWCRFSISRDMSVTETLDTRKLDWVGKKVT
jgi:hypothetical protein